MRKHLQDSDDVDQGKQFEVDGEKIVKHCLDGLNFLDWMGRYPL